MLFFAVFPMVFTKQNGKVIDKLPGRPQVASCHIGLNGASMRRFPFVVVILLSKKSIGNSAKKAISLRLPWLVIVSQINITKQSAFRRIPPPSLLPMPAR